MSSNSDIALIDFIDGFSNFLAYNAMLFKTIASASMIILLGKVARQPMNTPVKRNMDIKLFMY